MTGQHRSRTRKGWPELSHAPITSEGEIERQLLSGGPFRYADEVQQERITDALRLLFLRHGVIAENNPKSDYTRPEHIKLLSQEALAWRPTLEDYRDLTLASAVYYEEPGFIAAMSFTPEEVRSMRAGGPNTGAVEFERTLAVEQRINRDPGPKLTIIAAARMVTASRDCEGPTAESIAKHHDRTKLSYLGTPLAEVLGRSRALQVLLRLAAQRFTRQTS